MQKHNVDRLRELLRGHEELVEEKRLNPEVMLRLNEDFRQRFGAAMRASVMPVLEEIKDIMVGKVESASIFHRSTAAGLRVKLDPQLRQL